MNPPAYTAAQIARVLGKTRQSVQRALQNVDGASEALVSGNLAKTWPLESLPPRLSFALEQQRKRRNLRSVADLFQQPVVTWSPPLPLDRVHPRFVEKAIRLREAMSLPLTQQHTLSADALTELGRKEFIRVFGYPLSARKWNQLFDQILQRDGGRQEWQRVEIYLDKAAFVKPAAPAPVLKRVFQHRELDEVIEHLENRQKPTVEDRAWLFDAAFRHFEELAGNVADKAEKRLIKDSLLHYLVAALPCPALSKTPKALRRVFAYLFTGWQERGRTPEAITDQRRLNSGNFRRPDFTKDKKTMRNLAIEFGGRESLAHRYARKHGLLSREYSDYYSFDIRVNKSYVPATIRADITPEVEMTAAEYRGPRQAQLAGPYIPRDWSGVEPGDFFSADDVTWNHVFWYEDEHGEPQIARGECLLMCDLRTGYPLHHLLICGHYNSEHIRSLGLKAHDKAGLPHCGYYFEQSVWRARLVPGERRRGAGWVHWRETQHGLQKAFELKLELRHATTPRAKLIEGLLGILQERMRIEPGFVGFNERTERMERMQDFLSRVRFGKEHPGNELLNVNDWNRRIDAILEEFRDEPQNGKLLPGISPAEAWQAGMERRPLRKLTPEQRFIFASYQQVVTVRPEGILLTIRGQKHLYLGEATGRFINRKVIAFYNVECPDLLTFADLDLQQRFSARRVELPAMSATPAEQGSVRSLINAHRKPAKVIHSQLKPHALSTLTRDTDYSEAVTEFGRFHNAEVEKFQTEQAAGDRKLRRIRTQAAVLGSPVSSAIRNPDRVLEGQQREKEVLVRIERKQNPASPDQGEAKPVI